MANPQIIVLGSINTDLVIRAPRLPAAGETVTGGEFFQAAGGKGANQAVAAARAGTEPVVLIAAVGDDPYGHDALAGLRRENLVTDWIKVVPGCATGVALIMVGAAGENAICVAPGANWRLSPHDVAVVPDDLFRSARVFLACLESPLETVEFGLARAKAAGLVTLLNPAPADAMLDRPDVLRLVDVLTPNQHEARALAALAPTHADPLAAARSLQQFGCRACVVTLGAEGCLVVEESVTEVPACPVEALDTTAAGDAFSGALAVALAEGKSLADAARWASRAAAIAVTRRGAQPSLPTRREIEGMK